MLNSIKFWRVIIGRRACSLALVGSIILFACPTTLLASQSSGVRIADGNLTIKTAGVPIRQTLAAIAQQSGFEVMIRGDNDFPVQEKFSGVPLVEAIKRLLRGINYLVIFDKQSGKSPGETKIKKLIVNLGPPATPSQVPPSDISSRVRKEVAEPPPKESLPAGEEQEENPQPMSPATIQANLVKLGDENAENRRLAVESLAKANDLSVFPALIGVMLNDPDMGVRAGAAMALGTNGGPKAITPLVQALHDKEPWVRVNAIEALAQIGGEEVIPHLKMAQSDDDVDVANSAVMALRELPAEKSGVGERVKP